MGDISITGPEGAVLRHATFDEAMLFNAPPDVEVLVVTSATGSLLGVVGLSRVEEGVLLRRCTASNEADLVARMIAQLCETLFELGDEVYLALEPSPVVAVIEKMVRFASKDKAVVHLGKQSMLAYQCAPEQTDPRHVEARVAAARRDFEALVARPDASPREYDQAARRIQRLSDDIDLLGDSLFNR